MTGPPTPSRSSSFASGESSILQNNAALLGAATAFSRPTQPSMVASKSYSGTHGALAAATSADAANKTPSPSRGRPRSPLSRVEAPAGISGNYRLGEKSSVSSLNRGNFSSLAVPQQEQPAHVRSPSQQAAVLAAARAPPLTTPSSTSNDRSPRARARTVQRPSVAPKPRRLSQQNVRGSRQIATDDTSIPPTTSLVDLFEQRARMAASTPNKRPEPIVIRPNPELAITSPKPVKPKEGITSMFHMELDDAIEKSPTKTEESMGRNEPRSHGLVDSNLHGNSFAYLSDKRQLQSSPISIAEPPQREKDIHATPLRPTTASGSNLESFTPSPTRSTNAISNPVPIKPPPRSSTAPSESFSSSMQSLKTISAQYNQLYPRRQTPKMTGDDLANAMVASSLASSRAPSPTRLELPPVPTRKKKGQSKLPFSRTPSPAKTGMLHTLRNHESSTSDSEDEHHPYGKHKKKRLVRKHPNKHHEGDRKRWRDAVTERERRRYEGVWAANKGLHCAYTPEEEELFRSAPHAARTLDIQAAAADQVSNVVARDIWARSRLADNVLETVWDLVDNDCVGRLHKVEFVVGLWLIDQRLKGRKLPVKVTESVWASVRGLQGIKIRKK